MTKENNTKKLYKDALYEHFINMGLPMYKAEMEAQKRETEKLYCSKCKKETNHYIAFGVKECKECSLLSHIKLKV